MGIENIINSGLTREMLDMTYPDEYYKNTIQPAKAGTGPVPSKTQMLSKFQPFKAMAIGADPYLPGFMKQGYDKFRAAPTASVGKAASFLGSLPFNAALMTLMPTRMANAEIPAGMTAQDMYNSPAEVEARQLEKQRQENMYNNYGYMGSDLGDTSQFAAFNRVADQDLEADEGAMIQQGITPALTLRNRLGNLKNKAGKGFNFAKQLPGMALSYASGIPFAGQILSGLGNMFEDRQLAGGDGIIVDEFGRSYTADQLNSQNALGGYYTDAARSSRRRNKSIEKMMKRQQEDGLSRLGQKRLEKLKAQKAIEDQARTAQYGKTNYGRGAGGQSYSNMGTQGFGVAAGGYGGPVSNRTGSGRQGYSQGGLATMFVEKK